MSRKQEKERLDEIIGKNIRLEREARKLTRDELAEMMELTTSHMGLIERGERGATAVTLSKISRAFDIPIDHLFASPKKGGLSVREGETSVAEQKSKKVQSLITCLDDPALDFLVHTIKGIITLSNSISSNDIDYA